MIDLAALTAAVARHGTVVRVVVASVAGSSPRETGAAMIVWADGQDGTIGGGALEWEATAWARGVLASGDAGAMLRRALGPTLGQCCGGSVTLVAERWDRAALVAVSDVALFARPLPETEGPMPLAVVRALKIARNEGVGGTARMVQGWFLEPVSGPRREIWVWGAGHVGRALVGVIAPLPGNRVTWIDTDRQRFPGAIPDGVALRVAPEPGTQVAEAPAEAEHFVLTFSHALDLDLCHRLLLHGFGRLGLIGSATKRARFRSRLRALGHSDAAIDGIDCPIGDPSLGKHPQAIAVGVAAALLSRSSASQSAKDRAG
jgi:xanthine dehydrogenase accessory factor